MKDWQDKSNKKKDKIAQNQDTARDVFKKEILDTRIVISGIVREMYTDLKSDYSVDC